MDGHRGCLSWALSTALHRDAGVPHPEHRERRATVAVPGPGGVSSRPRLRGRGAHQPGRELAAAPSCRPRPRVARSRTRLETRSLAGRASTPASAVSDHRRRRWKVHEHSLARSGAQRPLFEGQRPAACPAGRSRGRGEGTHVGRHSVDVDRSDRSQDEWWTAREGLFGDIARSKTD